MAVLPPNPQKNKEKRGILMKIITVFYKDCYTEEHNAAMHYMVNNLGGATVIQDTETATRLELTEEALKVIKALEDADCLYFE